MSETEAVNSEWHLTRRKLDLSERPLVMGILNFTPDSFSDGGKFFDIETAIKRAEEMVREGADIVDVGGESTRPGASQLSDDEEVQRVVPLIEQLAEKLLVPISIDTTKASVAHAALAAGAEIVNDISGLRFEPDIAIATINHNAGLVLMHSRGEAATLHTQTPVEDVFMEVERGLRESVAVAIQRGVKPESIVVDPGIGFGKTHEQNLELIASTQELVAALAPLPLLIGTSRKRFIGRLLHDAPVEARLHGTMATVAAAVLGGARIIRVHDVRAAVETVRVAEAIRRAGRP